MCLKGHKAFDRRVLSCEYRRGEKRQQQMASELSAHEIRVPLGDMAELLSQKQSDSQLIISHDEC